MKMKKWLQVAFAAGSMMALAACSSTHKNADQMAINDANSAYGAHASGVDDGAEFGDQAGGTMASKRVYYFDFDSNAIHDEDRPAIAANGNYLASRQSAKATVEGHTDPRGSREYNVGLGERRAKAVAGELTAKGASSSQVRVVSYGAEKLASSGNSEADYQKDRRVVLAYTKR